MQEMILILSRCQSRILSPKTQKNYFKFHFKGFYSGLKIKEIHVYVTYEKEPFSKGDDYLLWVKLQRVKESALEVSLVKYKKIE